MRGTTPTGSVPERAERGAPRRRRQCLAPSRAPTAHGGPLRLLRYRALFSGPVVERVEELQFQRPDAEIELSAHDAEVRNIATGEDVRRPLERHRGAHARPGQPAASSTAPSAPPRSTSAQLDQARRGEQAVNNGEPWWIGADQGADLHQRPADLDGLPDALRAQAARADAAPLRPEPRRPEGPPPAVRRPDQDGAQGGVRARGGDRLPLPRWRPRSRRSRRSARSA